MKSDNPPTLTDLVRPPATKVINPIVKLFARMGLTPNSLTLLGLLLNIIVGVVLSQGHIRLGGILLVVASIFDAFDGSLARYTGQESTFGAFLDSVVDRLNESAVLIGLIYYFGQAGSPLLTVVTAVALAGSLLVSYTRARAESLGLSCKVGWFTRVERMFVLSVSLILGWTDVVWVMAIFTLYTTYQRATHVSKNS